MKRPATAGFRWSSQLQQMASINVAAPDRSSLHGFHFLNETLVCKCVVYRVVSANSSNSCESSFNFFFFLKRKQRKTEARVPAEWPWLLRWCKLWPIFTRFFEKKIFLRPSMMHRVTRHAGTSLNFNNSIITSIHVYRERERRGGTATLSRTKKCDSVN